MSNSNEVSNEEEQLIEKLNSTCQLPSYMDYTFFKLKQHILQLISPKISSKILLDDIHISITPDHIEGDITLDIFYFGKMLSTNPIALCSSLVESIDITNSNYLSKVIAVKGYLNFFLKKSTIVSELTQEIMSLSFKFGHSNRFQGQVAVVDYSGPNIAKPIGVGHLRSTIIGQSLANIYEATGYISLRINHIGDWGTQFGALIHAYDNFKDEDAFNEDPINALKSLYVKFHELKKDNPELEDAARERFSLLEQKNNYEYEQWKTFRQLSIDSFEKIYKLFDISFDAYQGESFFSDKIQSAIEKVTSKNISSKEDDSNALIVKDLHGLPTFLLQKEDGSSLYITRDLAALIYRSETFKPDTVLYVVGNEQALHFKQLFALYNDIESNTINNLQHIGFGLILTDGKKMSTRKGTLIELTSLIDKARTKVAEILADKGTQLDDSSIETIAIGCIIYNDLSRSRTKNIDFNWEKMLSMESGSSVYLQYTYARINSMITKLRDRYDQLIHSRDNRLDTINDDELQLYLQLLFFTKTIETARETNMPNTIASFLDTLAQDFNTYYAKYKIKDSNDSQFIMRYEMLICLNQTFKNGLKLLNINTVDKM